MSKENYTNFLTQSGNFFIFSTPKCRCTKDTIHDEHDKPVYAINVRTLNKEPIEYYFSHLKGLTKRSQNNKDENKCCPLEALLSLKLDNTEKSADKLMDFIEQFGFFFTSDDESYYHADYTDLCTILKKIQALATLLSTISKPDSDHKYNEMYNKIMELNFNQAIRIEINDRALFPTVEYPFYDYLIEPNSIPADDLPSHYIQKHQVEDTNPDQYIFYDTFSDKTIKCKDVYYDGYINQSLEEEEEEDDDENGKINYLYYNYLGTDYTRYLIDFHWHLMIDINGALSTPSDKYDLQRGIITYLKNHDLDQLEVFDDKYKKFLTMIAKLTIKKEMDSIISIIHPVYNTDNMAPDWEIKNLFTGMYLSLLYMNPKQEMYRKCSRPRCNEYFRINTTNNKKKYCSDKCRNAVAQQNYRSTHPINTLED